MEFSSYLHFLLGEVGDGEGDDWSRRNDDGDDDEEDGVLSG